MRAFMLRLVGEGAATRPCADALPSPSSSWSGTRTWRPCSQRWQRAASSPLAKAPSRSPTKRCCASGRACASGSRRTRKVAGCGVTSRRPRPSGTRPVVTRASSTAARLVAALDWSTDHAFELNELERVREGRAARPRAETRRPGTRTGASAPYWPAPRSSSPPPLWAASSRSTSAARRATRRRHSSRSGSAPRRSSRTTSTSRCSSPARRSRSTTPADPRLPARRPAARSGGDRDHACSTKRSPGNHAPAGRAYRCGQRLLRQAHVLRRRDARAQRRAVRRPGWVESLAYSPDGKTLAYGGIGDVTLLDALTRKPIAHTSVEGTAARLAFTRDGSKLVLQTEGGSIYIRDAATLKPVGLPIRPDGRSPPTSGRITSSLCPYA